MKDFSKIDKNFKVETKLNEKNIVFKNALEAPFKIYGVFKENGRFRRMPEGVAKQVSEGVHFLHTNTAGGRVRFTTDSRFVAINAKVSDTASFPHFALCGTSGFDLYADGVFCNSFIPPKNLEDSYEKILYFEGNKRREITINFPSYCSVSELYVGLEDGASVGAPTPYKYEKPVVFYGSSITQGGCASTPGMSYENIVSRHLDCNYVNLGFSGNAMAEESIAEYVSTLDMSVFVYDYDHNSPNTEHLQATHERMFKTVREKNPSLPIILMSRPKYMLNDEEKKRLEIITTTYNNAINNNDKNVYLIDNKALTALCLGQGTVDNCHPTDFGFASMAIAVEKVLKDVLMRM